MATWEEASRCPKCRNQGESTAPQPSARPGTKIVNVYCRNPLCKWCDTAWPVQINPDGSIPDPRDRSKEDKLYPIEKRMLQTSISEKVIQQINDEAAGTSLPGQYEIGGHR